MLSWQWPALFLLLPIPLIVRWLSRRDDVSSTAIQVPFFDALQNLDQAQVSPQAGNWLKALLLWLLWTSLVAAVARPTWVGEPVSLPQDRRDLMLAVDISGSMEQQDMLVNSQYTNRITAVKAVVGEFVEQRASDRLGLILFGQQAYLQTPLTHDSKTVNQQLQEAQLGFAGNATAIGDAIGLAIKRLRGRPAESRVLILLTDGANNAGTDPLEAAAIAAEANIRIHTIGVGADEIITRGFFGQNQRINPSSDLDETTLEAIADKTGGKYFRARDPQELQQIYAEIDKLEPIPDEQTFRPSRSLLHWPLSAALGFSLLLMLFRRFL
jgi:Ca-activated chloride channel family protein